MEPPDDATNFNVDFLSVFFPPLVVITFASILLSSIGLTIGVTNFYKDILLQIFEFCRKTTAKARRKKHLLEEIDEDESSDSSEESSDENNTSENQDFILKDDMLVPDPQQERPQRQKNGLRYSFSIVDNKREFHLNDSFPWIKNGIDAIIDDEVTKRFCAEELQAWNLMTRTTQGFEFINWKLTTIWLVGFVFRYAVLLPMRVTITFIGVVWLVVCTAAVGCLPKSSLKRSVNAAVTMMCFRILGRALSAVINFHNQQHRPKNNGVCVANHTSPIDCLVLACDNVYSFIGQKHGGFLGLLERSLARASQHVWFERSELKDRAKVKERIQNHVDTPDSPPVLIFPEGTCINNTSVMQFKKGGSFEMSTVIYPVAIKYDVRFGDAFWNSSIDSFMAYLCQMWTSWALVVDVWYLPPAFKQPAESAVEFANRVKADIARQGGLVDLMWDGNLKRMTVKKEWIEKQQEQFSAKIC